MRAIGVIPARFASTRFPGKPLKSILGKPLLQWVIEAALGSKLLEEILVATDHPEIEALAKKCGVKAVMTDPNLATGSDRVYQAVKAALTSSLGESTIVLCHISHVYETGASLYFTVAARQSDDPVAQWLAAKAAASDAMVHHGASITHHHAVGQDHKPWLAEEIGPVGVMILRAVKERLDPTGVLNPGVLIP